MNSIFILSLSVIFSCLITIYSASLSRTSLSALINCKKSLNEAYGKINEYSLSTENIIQVSPPVLSEFLDDFSLNLKLLLETNIGNTNDILNELSAYICYISKEFPSITTWIILDYFGHLISGLSENSSYEQEPNIIYHTQFKTVTNIQSVVNIYSKLQKLNTIDVSKFNTIYVNSLHCYMIFKLSFISYRKYNNKNVHLNGLIKYAQSKDALTLELLDKLKTGLEAIRDDKECLFYLIFLKPACLAIYSNIDSSTILQISDPTDTTPHAYLLKAKISQQIFDTFDDMMLVFSELKLFQPITALKKPYLLDFIDNAKQEFSMALVDNSVPL